MSGLAMGTIRAGASPSAPVEMPADAREFYDEVIEAWLSRLVALIEPVIPVKPGAFISGFLCAFYLPTLQLSSRIQGG